MTLGAPAAILATVALVCPRRHSGDDDLGVLLMALMGHYMYTRDDREASGAESRWWQPCNRRPGVCGWFAACIICS